MSNADGFRQDVFLIPFEVFDLRNLRGYLLNDDFFLVLKLLLWKPRIKFIDQTLILFIVLFVVLDHRKPKDMLLEFLSLHFLEFGIVFRNQRQHNMVVVQDALQFVSNKVRLDDIIQIFLKDYEPLMMVLR